MVDHQQTEQQDGLCSYAYITKLEFNPVQGNFDAAHLKEVHRRIFEGQPQHAPGEYRPDAPAHIKARALENSDHRYHVHYAPRSQVDSGVEKILADFGGPNSLRGLNAEQFSERMAKLYSDLDYLHPFKEGNSRTLRTFTAQIAREAGYKLDWNTTNVDAASRDRLYIARDKEVTQRAFPDLDETRAMLTDSRDEYEAYALVVAPFRKSATLQTLIKDATCEPKDLAAAKSFREESPNDAIKKNPALAGSYAMLAAIVQKAEVDGMNPQQRAVVVTRVRENIATSIERGERPQQNIREVQTPEKGADPELGR
ncbi:hypothetical protein FACS1894154_07940 [Betaproteobacteria bacterium]|nr:hypothetical protein FACS1894154_07940 [Betaproteobacteria bacterium]